MNGQWNIMASVLIDSGKYIEVQTRAFTDELSVVQLCQTDPLRLGHFFRFKFFSSFKVLFLCEIPQ